MADSGEYTPETITSRQKIADQLLLQATKPREIRHWAQGLGQLGEAAFGGWLGYKAEEEQKQGTAAQAAAIASLLNGGAPTPASGAPGPAADIAPEPQVDPSRPPTTLVGDNPIMPRPQPAPQRLASLSQGNGIVAPPRAAVQPSTKVWGDKEAEAAGLYEPSKPAAFSDRFAGAGVPGVAAALGGGPKPVQTIPIAPQPAAAAPPAAAPLPPPTPVAQNAPAATAGAPPMDNKAAVAKMLNDTNPYVRKLGIQLGQAAVAKQLNNQPEFQKLNDEQLFEKGTGRVIPAGSGFRALVDPAARAAHGIPADDKRPYQVGPGNKLINPPPETRVTTNVGGGSDKQIFDAMEESAKSARSTAAGLTAIREARNAIQGGAFTGAGANQILGLQKIGAALGLSNSDKIVNTETFRSAIAPQVAAMLKNTVGTTNISNTDREFAEKAAGGNITLDERSINRLLDIMERAGTGQLESHQKKVEKIYPDAEKHGRERALFGVDMPAAPQAAGGASSGAVQWERGPDGKPRRVQ